jgi:hypothetical protein
MVKQQIKKPKEAKYSVGEQNSITCSFPLEVRMFGLFCAVNTELIDVKNVGTPAR